MNVLFNYLFREENIYGNWKICKFDMESCHVNRVLGYQKQYFIHEWRQIHDVLWNWNIASRECVLRFSRHFCIRCTENRCQSLRCSSTREKHVFFLIWLDKLYGKRAAFTDLFPPGLNLTKEMLFSRSNRSRWVINRFDFGPFHDTCILAMPGKEVMKVLLNYDVVRYRTKFRWHGLHLTNINLKLELNFLHFSGIARLALRDGKKNCEGGVIKMVQFHQSAYVCPLYCSNAYHFRASYGHLASIIRMRVSGRVMVKFTDADVQKRRSCTQIHWEKIMYDCVQLPAN